MTTLAGVAPRVRLVPESMESLGVEAAELSASAGLVLDEWQKAALVDAMGVGEDDRWSAFEVGLNVARQNGKGAVLEARELAGLFLLGEQLIIHSAHEFRTSQEHFRRLEGLIQDTPELQRQVKAYSHSHGSEGIELKTGQRIVFATRTKGGSRGFSADLVVLDEAMVISSAAHGVMMPILRASKAQRGPQVWYAGSAVDQDIHEHGVVWARVRERGIHGAEALAYLEWSAEAEHPSLVTDEMALDEDEWQRANPGLGVRISVEHMRREQRSMDVRTFAVELLGVGDWPATDGLVDAVISAADWAAVEDSSKPAPPLRDPVCFAFDVSPERKTSIAAAGRRDDGLLQVEILEHKQGTGWLPDRLAELVERHDPAEVVCAGSGPVASVAQAVEDAGVKLKQVSEVEHGQACSQLLDLVGERKMRHLGSDELARALRGAKVRPLGDAWAWSRKSSAVDISPLVASTLALWAAEQQPEDGVLEIF